MHNSLDTEKRETEADQMGLLYVKSWKRRSSSCWVTDESSENWNQPQNILCCTKDRHFTSIQYLDARIHHEGFLTTIYVNWFGTFGKKKHCHVDFVVLDINKSWFMEKFEWWYLKNYCKLMRQLSITKLIYCRSEEGIKLE